MSDKRLFWISICTFCGPDRPLACTFCHGRGEIREEVKTAGVTPNETWRQHAIQAIKNRELCKDAPTGTGYQEWVGELAEWWLTHHAEEVKTPGDDGEPIEVRFYVCRNFDNWFYFLKQEGTYKQWVRDWQKATAWRSEKEAKESAAVSFDCVVEMTVPLCEALGVTLKEGE